MIEPGCIGAADCSKRGQSREWTSLPALAREHEHALLKVAGLKLNFVSSEADRKPRLRT